MTGEALACPLPLALAEPLPWAQVRLGATMLLAMYIVLAVIFSQRELGFLAQLKPGEKRLFVTLDLLIQLSVLAILLPCILAPGASLPTLVTVMVGFGLLWIVVIWNGMARSMYTYRLMLEFRNKAAEGLKDPGPADARKGERGTDTDIAGQERMDG